MLTPELAAQRLGKLCASDAAVICGGDSTKGLLKLVKRLAGERLHGDLRDRRFKSWQMECGDEEEDHALDWAEFVLDEPLQRQQHINHPTIPLVAATPDGLARGRFTVEAKCPTWEVFCDSVEAWHRGKRGMACIPSEYRHQCRWQPWCCGLTEGRFVAFHPAGGGRGVVVPYEITQEDCDAMAARVVVVEGLIANWIDILRG